MHHVSKHWYDKYYKIILFAPVVLLIICLVYLISFYSQNGDIIYKDPSLSGGTTITLTEEVNVETLELHLQESIPDVHIRTISDISTGRQIAALIESSSSPEVLRPLVEDFIGKPLNEDNSSIEFSGPSLSDNFYKQLAIAVIISFTLMSLVIFFLFKTFIPSIAVIFSAFADIVMAVTVANLFEIRLSAAGIAAFLMLIGYSVDNNILLTMRVLKNRGQSVNSRIYSSFKTGILMTCTGLAALIPAFFIVTGLPDSFRQIFFILAVGLSATIINTWFTNASIIKWYAEHKKLE
jgi:preprotein translocase subunit SecF